MPTPTDIPEPWNPAQATERIRSIAAGEFAISYTQHALDQIADRDLIIGDVIYLLKNGFVYERPEKPARTSDWKYQMQCRTPNSGQREVRVVVIPDWRTKALTLVTVMWTDEPRHAG
ncbi:MAG: DUF4258 domain-containing protein [Pseudolabrys sp.]|nr:DUF4258 domain-containing protein [Pseudolabrys sp.]